MALSDYRLCDICSQKAFYDAKLQYDFKEWPDTGLWEVGNWKVLCRSCSEIYDIEIKLKVCK